MLRWLTGAAAEPGVITNIWKKAAIHWLQTLLAWNAFDIYSLNIWQVLVMRFVSLCVGRGKTWLIEFAFWRNRHGGSSTKSSFCFSAFYNWNYAIVIQLRNERITTRVVYCCMTLLVKFYIAHLFCTLRWCVPATRYSSWNLTSPDQFFFE